MILALLFVGLCLIAAIACLVGIAHELIIKDDHTTYTPLDILGGSQ